MTSGSSIAKVDDTDFELTEQQRLIPNKDTYTDHLVPLITIMDLLGIKCIIKNNKIEAEIDVYPNSSASDIFDFDEILSVKNRESLNGPQPHKLFFANPKAQNFNKR